MNDNYNEFIIKELSLSDAYKFKDWQRGNHYLLKDYDFVYEKDWEIKAWYQTKKGLFMQYYVIYYNDKPIAYIGLKHINYFLRKAELSIVMDVAYQGQGYGYKILVHFLRFAFTDLKLKKVWLDVNAFNKRAIHLYKKIGFTKKAYFLDTYNIQDIDRTSKEYIENEDEFRLSGNTVFSFVYTYEIKRGEFFELYGGED